MGLIEQAAKRLEELRRAGVEIAPAAPPPEPIPTPAPVSPPPTRALEPVPGSAFPAPAAVRAPGVSVRRGPDKPAERHAVKIDLARLAALGFVTPDVPRSQIADEFRILKRPLIANATPKSVGSIKNGNLVMVTSSVPHEGKTFTSINLAMSIAMELDRTVLLVDGDVARPSLPRTLDLESRLGLLDLVGSKGVELNDVIIRTNVPNLTVLLAGSPHPRATEMLASNAMGQFLDYLVASDPNRIVIFDSPPLLPTTEARLLATRMGQIVFVVHAETTLQGEVKQALATIEACPIKLLVLNGATTSGQGIYGYGYSYGYGSTQ